MPWRRRAAANSARRGPAISSTAERHDANRSGGMGVVMAMVTTGISQPSTDRGRAHHSGTYCLQNVIIR
jgi:hypothetical protein